MPISKELRPLYKTPEWKAAKALVIRRARNRCEWCGKPHGKKVWTPLDSRRGLWRLRWRHDLTQDPPDNWWTMPGFPAHVGPTPPLPGLSIKPGEPVLKMRLILVKCGPAHLDHNPANNDPSNLAYLCQRCHLVYDNKHHYTTARLRRDRATGQLRLELVA